MAAWAVPIATIAFALALIVYNNVAYTFYHIAFPPDWVLYPRAILVPAIAVLGAVWVCRLSLAEVGLGRGELVSGAATGFALAIAAALPVALVLAGISLLDIDAFSFRNIDRAAGRPGYALYWAFVLYPLHTVIFEEVLFRGVLQGLATRVVRLDARHRADARARSRCGTSRSIIACWAALRLRTILCSSCCCKSAC